MSKITKKETESKRRVEGYIDRERNVFVATADPDGILEGTYEPPVRDEISYKNVKELLDKYKPVLKWE